MKETVDWLLKIENLAHSFYGEVGVAFKEDEKFSQFFRHLSQEEAWHAKVMESALEYLLQHSTAFSISVDDKTKEKIEATFINNRELLSAGDFSRESVIDCLVTTELSEWNNIFVYVVQSLKEDRKFMPVAAKMHRHLLDIEHFLGALPEGRRHLPAINSLPRVWKEHILIIDDDLAIVNFLSKLLEFEGQVSTAQNGKEGLQKIKEQYFDVIISDISMPVMNGLEFYSQASAFDPEIGKRIIFFSGAPSPEHTNFFKQNNLKFLMKPAPIMEIVNNVSAILHKT